MLFSTACLQVLARLAVDEPGENWVGETYCWSFAQRYDAADRQL